MDKHEILGKSISQENLCFKLELSEGVCEEAEKGNIVMVGLTKSIQPGPSTTSLS